MEGPTEQLFGGDIEFPVIPQEKIPEEEHALQRIVAGQHALLRLYGALDEALRGEPHCLVVLLGRDFDRHFRSILVSGQDLMSRLRYNGSPNESLPPPEAIERIVASLADQPPSRVHEVVAAFAARALICHQMVPWVSNLRGVFEHFQACVEAEDRHLSVIDLFRELLHPNRGTA